MAKKSNRKKKKGGVALFVVEVLILLVLVVCVFAYAKLNEGLRNIGPQTGGTTTQAQGPVQDTDDVVINPEVAVDNGLRGYTNIALVGIDTRENDIDYANSDTMLICSINNDTWEVRLISLYRDTFVCSDPEDWKFNKANNAYAVGSTRQFLSMLNANLDLNITDYVIVDFNAVATLVDDLGGITVYMTEEEAVHLNNYCKEVRQVTGKDYTPLEIVKGQEARDYDLNGVQAVSYARIRYTTGNDFKRTQRQRLVIEKIVDKAKQKGLKSIQAVIEDVFPLCKTSFSSAQIIKMASQMFNYNIVLTSGFPFEHIEMDLERSSGSPLDIVVPVTLEQNVKELHEYLFNDTDYQVSEQVKAYSQEIIDQTGYGEEWIERARELSVIPNNGGEADIVR